MRTQDCVIAWPWPGRWRPGLLSLLLVMPVALGGQPLSLNTMIEARADGQAVVTITFNNISGDLIHDARIDAAVPAGYRYVQGSAQGPAAIVLYSVDGGERFLPGTELAAARSASRDASDDEALTHVRWVLPGPFDPGARGQVRFLVGPVDAPSP